MCNLAKHKETNIKLSGLSDPEKRVHHKKEELDENNNKKDTKDIIEDNEKSIKRKRRTPSP